jgi:hypothetical protein
MVLLLVTGNNVAFMVGLNATIALTPLCRSHQRCQLQPTQQDCCVNGRWRLEDPQMATFVVSFTICLWRLKYELCWFWIRTAIVRSTMNVGVKIEWITLTAFRGSHIGYLVTRYKLVWVICCHHLQGRTGALVCKGIMCQVGKLNKMWGWNGVNVEFNYV